MISGLSPPLYRPLSTFHDSRYRQPCKTRFRLAGCAFAGRVSNPLDRCERFQVIPHLMSLLIPRSGACLTQAGRMGAATSTTSGPRTNPGSPGRRSTGSASSTTSSARSPASPPRSGEPSASRKANPWPSHSGPGPGSRLYQGRFNMTCPGHLLPAQAGHGWRDTRRPLGWPARCHPADGWGKKRAIRRSY